MTNLPLCQNRLQKSGTKIDYRISKQKQESKSGTKLITKLVNSWTKIDYQNWFSKSANKNQIDYQNPKIMNQNWLTKSIPKISKQQTNWLPKF